MSDTENGNIRIDEGLVFTFLFYFLAGAFRTKGILA